MSDLINRKSALKALRPIMRKSDYFYEMLKAIQDIPPAEPEQRWIPCSERLPEEDACYLVTTSGTNNDIIDIAYYTEGIWHKASRIKAWMPLPEPYKEGE